MMTTGLQAAPWRPGTFEEWVSYAPTAYLKCWDQGHRYTDWTGNRADWQRDGSCMLYQVCPSCGLPRDRWIGTQGQVDGNRNRYHYHRMERFQYPYTFRDRRPLLGQGTKEKRARIRLELLRREVLSWPVPNIPGTTRPAEAIRFQSA